MEFSPAASLGFASHRSIRCTAYQDTPKC